MWAGIGKWVIQKTENNSLYCWLLSVFIQPRASVRIPNKGPPRLNCADSSPSGTRFIAPALRPRAGRCNWSRHEASLPGFPRAQRMSVVFAHLYDSHPRHAQAPTSTTRRRLQKQYSGRRFARNPTPSLTEGRKYAEPGMGTTVPAGASRSVSYTHLTLPTTPYV